MFRVSHEIQLRPCPAGRFSTDIAFSSLIEYRMLSGEEKRRNEAAAKAARAKPKPKAAAAAAAAGAKLKLSAEEQKQQNQALYGASENGEMGKLEAAIAAGAEVDWHNPDVVSELSELE